MKIIVKLLLTISLVVPMNMNAGFLSDLVTTLTTTTTASAEVSVEMLGLFDSLAQDIDAMADKIGEMADRILVMADKIGVMADRILVMADKIVATEELMATMAVDIATIKTSVSTDCTVLPTVVITSLNGSTLWGTQAPMISLNVAATEYLVYVSSSMTMNTNTISVLVHNNLELQSLWGNLMGLALNNQIFIAVKTIDANTISSLSNVLTYTIY